MQMQIVRKHFHADPAIPIQIRNQTNMVVHVLPIVIHEVMELKSG